MPYMRGLPKPGSMSEDAPVLIQLKQWCDKKCVSMAEFNGNPKNESFDGKPKNESFVIPLPTITGPHDLKPEPLDFGVHEESEDEPGVDEGAPGVEVLDSSDDMDEDNEILFKIPDGFELAQTSASTSG